MWRRNYFHTLSKKQNWVYLWINSLDFDSLFFIIYKLEDYWSIMKLSCRPFTLNSYTTFLKNKNRSGKTLCFIFYKIFEKLLYSITWPLTSNFHHLVKKILLPAKFHFQPHWGNFYNVVFSFKNGLNGQNHSSSDSHPHIKIPLPAKFPISSMGRYPRVFHRCWEHGEGAWIHTWGEIEGGGWG